MEHSKALSRAWTPQYRLPRPCAYELDLSQASNIGGSAADVLKALSLATDSTALTKSHTNSGGGAGGGKAKNGSEDQKLKRASSSQSLSTGINESENGDVGVSQANTHDGVE